MSNENSSWFRRWSGKEAAEQREMLEQAGARIDELEAALQSSETSLVRHTEVVSCLEQELERQQVDYEKRLGELRRGTRAELEALDQECVRYRTEAEEAAKKVQQLTRAASDKEKAQGTHLKKIAELQKRSAETTAQSEELRRELATTQAAHQKLQAEANAANTRTEQAREELAATKIKLDSLSTQAALANTRIENLQSSLSKAKDAWETEQRRRSEQEIAYKKSEAQLQLHRTEEKALQSRLRELEAEKQKLTTELAAQQKRVEMEDPNPAWERITSELWTALERAIGPAAPLALRRAISLPDLPANQSPQHAASALQKFLRSLGPFSSLRVSEAGATFDFETKTSMQAADSTSAWLGALAACYLSACLGQQMEVGNVDNENGKLVVRIVPVQSRGSRRLAANDA